MDNRKIRVAITHGDTNGIGYEIILKAFEDTGMLDLCTPIIYGNQKIATYHRNTLQLETPFSIISKAEDAHPDRLNMLATFDEEVKVEFGSSTPESAEAARKAMQRAKEDLKNGLYDVLVQAPVVSSHTPDPNDKSLLIMFANDIRIALATNHLPLKDVATSIRYAVDNHRKSVTFVHKGNIMKFTEGGFRDWGYALAKREFPEQTVTWDECGGAVPEGKILIKDCICDAFLQQILTRPAEYDVIATMNLNGDYVSDALAASVGGIGIAPGANINYVGGKAIFEATHGTAPKYKGLDKVNPCSLALSGEMLLRHIGWTEAADLVIRGIERAIASKRVTYDFARQMEGATELRCSEFARVIADNM